MRSMPLTKGKHALVDDSDFETLNQWQWRAQRARAGSNKFYAVRSGPTNNGKRSVVWMHVQIMEAQLKDGQRPDHVDGNGLNNQRHNLRPSTHRQNCQNKRTSGCNKSGYKGVSWKKRNNKWCAQIKSDGKVLHLGLFASPVDAARAYDAAAIKHFGQYAVTNSLDT
jgi:hypothetical protein